MMEKEWLAPERWVEDVEAAVSEFLYDTRITKKQFAESLGISENSLSPSHLTKKKRQKYIFQSLLNAFRGDNIYRSAARLRLDLRGLRALKRMAGKILNNSFPYLVDPERPLERSFEAYEIGMMGVGSWDSGDWDIAVPFLMYAWDFFQENPSDPSDSGLFVRLRVGTQLASWQSTTGEQRATFKTARTTLSWAKVYGGTERKMVEAISWLHNTAGTAYRHAGQHPQVAIAKHDSGQRLIVAARLPDTHRIPMLRNQAKPYAQWALREESERIPHFNDAIRVSVEAELAAGGDTPTEEEREQWLLSRLTRIECLVAMREDVQAERLWDTTMARDWVPTEIDRRRKALAAKVEFARMALEVARKELDLLDERARKFQTAEENALFGERLERAKRFSELARSGQLESLRALVVR